MRGEREVRVGLFDRIVRRLREEPAPHDAPGLFTAHSAAVPSDHSRTPAPRTEDLWDRAEPGPAPAPEPEPAPPPAGERRVAGSTADEPLFAAYEHAPEPPADEPAPAVRPQPLVVEVHPEAVAPGSEQPAPAPPPAEDPPADRTGRTVRVHDARLDTRPGPIRMTPSEAIRLAQDGPRSGRQRPDDPAS